MHLTYFRGLSGSVVFLEKMFNILDKDVSATTDNRANIVAAIALLNIKRIP